MCRNVRGCAMDTNIQIMIFNRFIEDKPEVSLVRGEIMANQLDAEQEKGQGTRYPKFKHIKSVIKYNVDFLYNMAEASRKACFEVGYTKDFWLLEALLHEYCHYKLVKKHGVPWSYHEHQRSMFRQACGMTPKEYRQLYTEKACDRYAVRNAKKLAKAVLS